MLKYSLDWNKDNIIEIAHGGNLDAQETIAFKYLDDDNFFEDSPNWGKAIYWLNVSAKNGSLFAFRCLQSLKRNPEDLTFNGKHPTSSRLLNDQSFSMSFEDELICKRKIQERKEKWLLVELIEYSQRGNRVCPLPECWNKIYHDYSWRTDTHDFGKLYPLRAPLLFDAWNTSSNEKRLRFLTQVYWCYKNNFIDSMYESIVNIAKDSWHIECCVTTPLPLNTIKKEYERWASLK
jgi:hypothetical protein